MTYYVRAYATNSIGTAYGNEISFVTIFPNCGTITDADGNIYETVTIGSQCWLQENLKTTKYNDMTDIPLVTDDSEWEALTTPGYCWYDNNAAAYKSTYGALYNWYSVSATTKGGKNVYPTGWRVPVDAEWTVLTDYLGGAGVAGGKLMETGTSHWLSNPGATNSSGFTGLPGGYRYFGFCSFMGTSGEWWSSNDAVGWALEINSSFTRYNYFKNGGLSIRCLKD